MTAVSAATFTAAFTVIAVAAAALTAHVVDQLLYLLLGGLAVLCYQAAEEQCLAG
jgi:hypothetical protein